MATIDINTFKTSLAKLSQPIQITDTVTNTSNYIDLLQANVSKISSITLSDSTKPILINTKQLLNDLPVIRKITGSYSLQITDTGENIGKNIDLLQANNEKIVSISKNDSLTNPTISIKQLIDDSLVLAKYKSNYILIKDTSNNISKNIDLLQSNVSKITKIIRTDIAPLAINSTQLINDSKILNVIDGGYTLTINDTSANITKNIGFLNTYANKIESIVIGDSKIPLALNTTQLNQASTATLLSKITSGYALAITDTSINALNNLGLIQINASKISSITLSDTSTLNIAINSGYVNVTTTSKGIDLSNVTLGLNGNGYGIKNGGIGTNLVGSKFNDTLTGGNVSDKLTGGNGNDIFVFSTPLDSKNNVDTITDFVSGADKIQLPLTVFAKVGVAGALKVDDFKLSTEVLDATDRIIYNSTTGVLSYDADGIGTTAAVQFAIVGVSTHPTLANTDFVIV